MITPNTADGLAALVTGPDFAEAVEQRRDHIADVLLDTLAVCAEAAVRPGLIPVSETVCGSMGGPATLLGSRLGGAAVAAAVSNGMAANATLLAEGHRGAGGHPAAHVVPAVMASAEATGASGQLLLEALAAGYEVAVRAREALLVTRPGLSPNGNWGTLGAAAGVAYLLSQRALVPVAQAIEAAAAVAIQGPMTFGHDGAESYRLFVGIGAAAGLAAGMGAAAGWGAPSGTFAYWFAGQSEDHRPEPTVFDATPAIAANYFKRFGTCAHTQSALDAVCALRADWKLDPWRDEVVAAEVRCGNQTAAMLPLDPPRNAFAARYSIPRMAAVAWWYGPEALLMLDDDLWNRPEVEAMATRTSVHYDTRLADSAANGRPTSVTLVLRDGRRLEHVVQVPRGDAQDPLSHAELRRKALTLLERAHGSEWATGVISAVDNLEEIGAGGLTKALRQGSRAIGVEAIPTFVPERTPAQ